MPDVTVTYSQAMHDRIVAKWGSVAAYRSWVRDTTRADIRNHMVNNAMVAADATLREAIAEAENVTGAL